MLQRHLFNHYLARTAGMLSGARRASLMLLVMLLTASNAWAGVVNLTEDTDETAGTAARWYVNMPETGSNSLTLADASITSFKVYDNGGKSGNYSNHCDGTLVITAPSGYGLRLSGSVCTESYTANDNLYAYDGNAVDDSKRILIWYSWNSNVWREFTPVTSTGRSMTLRFKSDNLYNYDGLDLTVTLVGAEDLSTSTITIADHFFWNNGNAVDITYTVKDANGTTLTKGTDYNETFKKGSTEVTGGVKDLGDYTMIISGTGSYTGEKTVNFSIVEENCLYGVISGTYPDYTMTLKYGNYYDDPASESANNKKKFTPGNNTWWNRYDDSGMKTIVIDASCQNYQGTSLSYLFYYWNHVTSITGLENLNYHNTVTDMSYMFGECDALTTFDVSSLNTASVTNMDHMFYSCGSLATINFGDGTKFNTSNVTNMNYMFTSCAALTELDLSSFSTTRLSNFERMFQSSSNLQTIIVSTGWDVVSGTRYGSYMFTNCGALVGEQGTTYNDSYTGRSYAHIDGGTSNKGYLTGRYTITYNTNGGTMPTPPYITTFTGKDDAFDLPTPTRTGYAFAGWCEDSELSGTAITSYPANTRGDKTLYAKWALALYAVVDGTNMTLKCGDPSSEAGSFTYNGSGTWNTSFKSTITTAVVDASCQNYTGTTLYSLFSECENLTTITGLDKLNTENVTNMTFVFEKCKALTSVDVSKFNTSKVKDMSYMFDYCQSLTTLDVSSFNTTKVTNMTGLFYSCDHLTTIDIRNFNTGEVMDMDYMFKDCDLLTTIIVGEGWSTAKVTSSSNMFKDDNNLVGQNGTAYNVSNIDATYACVDAAGTPGYLSLGLNEATGIVNAAVYADKKTQFTRTGITANAYSTVCLPFDFTTPTGCTVYGFQGIHYDENALGAGLGAWVADIAETTTMNAHTPYIFTCTGTEATFSGTASNAADYSSALESNAVSATVGDDKAWKFKGTYSAIDWSSADPTEPTYGFSTYVPAATTIAAGTFVRFVQGASLAPFRARLIYSGTDTHLNAPKRSAANDLPQYIIVRIVESDGSTTAIGTLDTRTGEMSTGDWFDLNGRRLSGKPTQKGLYINNGKKVVIK